MFKIQLFKFFMLLFSLHHLSHAIGSEQNLEQKTFTRISISNDDVDLKKNPNYVYILPEASSESDLFFGTLGTVRIDLHGKSLEKAKQIVLSSIQRNYSLELGDSIHFISGRGKHKNARGERGVIFKQLPEWLQEETVAALIERSQQTLGAYEVLLKRREQQKKKLPFSHVDLAPEEIKKLPNMVIPASN